MSAFLSENREQQLNDLDSFTKDTDSQLTNLLSSFGWSLDNLDSKEENDVLCPFNPAHRLPDTSLQEHIIACTWNAEGYDKFDMELSEPTLLPNAPSAIKIDEDLLKNILLTAKEKDPNMISGVGDRLIPRTSNRIFSDFTSDERRAIYDYVIANTQKVDIGHDITDLNKTKEKDEQKSISYLELIAQERNLKRRRAKHRGVHTNKKSHVEIMREVIEQQMEMFKEYLSEKNDVQCGNSEQTLKTELTFQEVTSDFSRNSMSDVHVDNRKCPEYDANYFQRVEANGKYYSREKERRERYAHHNDRKDSHHKSYSRDKHKSSESKHKSRDRSRHRDRSRDKQRNKSKDRYRNRSNDRRESKHDNRRSRRRDRSKTRR